MKTWKTRAEEDTMLRRWSCFAIVLLLVGACELSEEFEQGELDGQAEGVLGGTHFPGAPTCTTDQQDFLRDVQFITRTVATSDAFEQCLAATVPFQFVPCDGTVPDYDYLVTDFDAHVENARLASQNVSDLNLICDLTRNDAIASTPGGDFGRYQTENISWHQWLGDVVTQLGFARPCTPAEQADPIGNNCRFDAFPWPYDQAASTSLHESMHENHYGHGIHPGCRPSGGDFCLVQADCGAANLQCSGFSCDYDMNIHSMPRIVEGCVNDVIDQSFAVCGDICLTRSGDDISSCVNRKRLRLVSEFNGTSCRYQFDPNVSGLGLLGFDDGAFDAADIHSHGQRFGSDTSDWLNSSTNAVVATGDLTFTSPGDEFVVKSWSIGVIQWPGGNGTFDTAVNKPHGTYFSHYGDGSGTWRYSFRDQVEGTGNLDGASIDEIIIRSGWGLGVLSVSGSTMVTRNAIPWGTQCPGPFGWWTLGAGDEIVGIGDFNGDLRDDLLVKSAWGLGLLSRTAGGGEFSARDVRANGERIGDWWLSAGDEIVSVGDYNGDGKDDFIIRSAWGLGFISWSSTEYRFTSLRLTANNTSIIGGWYLRSTDRFETTGRFVYSTRDSAIIRGLSGIGMLRLSGSTPLVTFRKSIGGTYPNISADGDYWLYSDTDEVFGAGDFNGDGYDDFFISSDWGMAVIGRTSSTWPRALAIQQTDCAGADDYDACHGGFFGSWLARQTDEPIAVLEDGAGQDMLMLRGL